VRRVIDAHHHLWDLAAYREVCGVYRELTAELSAAEQDAIFGRTARRVYRLWEQNLTRQHGR
jgi:predicted TIM-barrel fold metal-dependent hydrolase